MQIIEGILKCSARFKILSRSWIPERVGSVIAKTRFTPVNEAVTGHPMPGGPSINMRSRFFSFAISTAFFRTTVTSFPEFSSPIPNRAWTKGPYGVSEINQSPEKATSMVIAFSGQICEQKQHPSHEIVLTTPLSIALKRQTLVQRPHRVHLFKLT